MEMRGKRVLVCDCEASMPLDAGKLAKACQAVGAEGELELNTQLCRAQLGNFQQAILGDKPVLVACTQEAPLFTELAAEDNPQAELAFTNIRERAGWSEQAGDATPKIAALIAEAALDIEPTPAVELKSGGVCLVYGKDERALAAAKQLAGRLEVTLLLSAPGEILPPEVMDVPIFKGTIIQAKGHLGAFGIDLRGYAAANPSARQALDFETPKDNAFTECDLILDLSGGAPLFPAHEKRDGYLRPDPDDPVAVQKALFELANMVGEYEKPRYIAYDAGICTHARNQITGCTRCLDVCPTSAIAPAGDGVEIDPFVCAGCGACASVCPTGAAAYQFPADDAVFQRLRTLLSAYREAGGADPVLLLHDTRYGQEMIAMMARAGRGLPAAVLPFPLNEVTQVGLDFLATAFAYGATQICVLSDPAKAEELGGLAEQIGLAETVMEGLGYGGGRVQVLDARDPEAVEAALYGLEPRAPAPAGTFLPMGGKRTRTMLALRHLHEHAPDKVEILPLPAGAPFGAVAVDVKGCTLCLACVGACPTGAMLDNPDRPWLGFNEEACVQCGLCQTTCPESVIKLEPRINFTEEARHAITKNQEEPFHCIRCGKPFGVQSTIERITDQLAGKHSMFSNPEQIERIMMCDDCRIVVQFQAPDDPFKGPPRPKPRTTDDYLREREIEEARAKLLAERAAGKDDGKGNGTGE
ncbi:MAG: 4Fe-4S binding protein [Proteobacteria bacterium]|nr:4Fe-4S binding protein [Pseudomonadota bacterium]